MDILGDTVGQIDLGLDINRKLFNKQLFGISKGAEKSVTSAFSGLGKKIGITLGTVAVGAFVKSCLDLGSDLAEVQNVVDVTFQEMNGSVNEFAKNAIEKFGLSETVAKKYMGTYGAMSKAFGFTEKQAYDMSETITGLTADVASFYNLGTDEAYTKMKSIWTGETESLKDLGVVMTQTALDQYALNNGFGKTTAKMTEQEKVMLRYQFVQSQLAAASGDFARTSDGWANQIRVLSLRFDSLKATLGQGFINLFTPIIRLVNSLMASLDGLTQKFLAFTELITGQSASESAAGAISSVVSEMVDSTDTLTDATSNLGSTAADAAKEAASGLAGFDKLNNVADDNNSSTGGTNSSSISGLTAATGTILGDIEVNPEIEKALNKIKEAIQPTIDALERLKEALIPFKDFVVQGAIDFYKNFLIPVGTWTLGEGVPRFLDITSSIFNDINWSSLNGYLSEFFKCLSNLVVFKFTDLLNFYQNFLAPIAVWTLGEGIPSFLEATNNLINSIDWAVLNESLANFYTQLSNLQIFSYEILLGFYKNLLVPLASWTLGEGIPRLVDSISSGLALIDYDKIIASFDNLWSSVEPFAVNIGEGLLWAVDNVLVPLGVWAMNNVVPEIIDGIANAFDILNGIVEALKPLGQWLWDNFLQPIAEWTGGVIVGVLDGINIALSGMSQWITDNQELVQVMTVIVGAFFAAWQLATLTEFIINAGGVTGALGNMLTAVKSLTVAKIADKVETLAIGALYVKDFLVGIVKSTAAMVKQAVQYGISTTALIANKVAVIAGTVATKAATIATSAFGVAMNVLTSPVTLVIAAIAALVAGIVLLIKNWDTVKEVGAKCWEGIKNAWKVASSWFSNNIVTPIKNVFTGLWSSLTSGASTAWTGVKNAFGKVTEWFGDTFSKAWTAVKNVFSTGGKIFDGIKDGILSGLKAVVNAIIGGINKVIAVPFDGLNSALRKIKNINILGVTPFSWISDIGVPQIPMLAQGGYVEANTPQLAMIGDNRHQGEVVAPEDKLQSLLDKAVSAGGTSKLEMLEIMALLRDILNVLKVIGDKDLIAYITSSELFRSLQKEAKAYTTKTGKPAF